MHGKCIKCINLEKNRVTKCDMRYNFNQMHQREYVSYDKCRRGHTSLDTYCYDLSIQRKKISM